MEPEKAYKFCLKCASPWKYEKNKFTCTNCGFVFFINPVPCVVLIIENDKDEILLVKRRHPPKAGTWDIPGGFMEPGETAEECAIREIKEELGVDLQNLKYLASYADRYEYKRVNYYTIGFEFSAQIKTLPKVAHDDISQFLFFSKHKIPYDKIGFASVAEGINKYLLKKPD